MPDRLTELRRQRALVRDHLDWLDREIAAAEPTAAQGTAPVAAPPPPPVFVTQDPVAPPATDAYSPDPAATQQEVKRGCLLWLVAGFVLFAAILAAIYFFAYGDRPLLFMER